ncbi:Aim19p KNAG_0A05370 [Huiozyma naganishii CBS 8797]|uniref:Uncharacterized protein n=1 Tax=Huiozyma naganishii (strain ATCC MYA-139 / BCRC 22969 / CBS 8797 / KCTC 17520 / NBRC 10181 / NCYC 3082 / Yp74L-3) TaxID=1071383 RepID=J7RTV2_HUIN7|nr:hypothetical protein KNAG_0A05370 [Kazachstania naganishii CBS 8797]CCK68202.1 hypothetical protein KNAG_0A05370 [Kazachstania naganishii CBS 8797]
MSSSPSNTTDLPSLSESSGVLQYMYDVSKTPYPGLVNAGMLLDNPIISPAAPLQVMAYESKSKNPLKGLGSFARTSNVQRLGISNKNALLFAAAQAAGSWMIYDNDMESGSGFLMAWSALFLLVNGKKSLNSLKYGKVWPVCLSAAALTSSLIYGKRFITGRFK